MTKITAPKVKPFAISVKGLTEENIAEVIEKSMKAFARLYEGIYVRHLGMETPDIMGWNSYQYWGVNEDNDTTTWNEAFCFGDEVVEISFSELESHLGLIYTSPQDPEQEETLTEDDCPSEVEDIPHVAIDSLESLLENVAPDNKHEEVVCEDFPFILNPAVLSILKEHSLVLSISPTDDKVDYIILDDDGSQWTVSGMEELKAVVESVAVLNKFAS